MFHAYEKIDNSTKRKKNAASPELLLHSTSHPTLDYIGREDRHNGAEPAVRQFVGVFDPKTGIADMFEAKSMVIRGTVRAQKASDEAMKGRTAQEVILGLFFTLWEWKLIVS